MIWLFPVHIPNQPSTNIIPRAEALGMILVSRVDTVTGCDTESSRDDIGRGLIPLRDVIRKSSRDDIGRGLIRDVIRKEPYILYIKKNK